MSNDLLKPGVDGNSFETVLFPERVGCFVILSAVIVEEFESIVVPFVILNTMSLLELEAYSLIG